MKVKIIRNKRDYDRALARLEAIFDAEKGTNEGDELEMLSMVIDNYEKEKYFIDFPDPIESIKFRMEQMDMRQKDLVDLIGFKSRVSEVLNRKRKLTLDMIRKISEVLSIPSEVLIREY